MKAINIMLFTIVASLVGFSSGSFAKQVTISVGSGDMSEEVRNSISKVHDAIENEKMESLKTLRSSKISFQVVEQYDLSKISHRLGELNLYVIVSSGTEVQDENLEGDMFRLPVEDMSFKKLMDAKVSKDGILTLKYIKQNGGLKTVKLQHKPENDQTKQAMLIEVK